MSLIKYVRGEKEKVNVGTSKVLVFGKSQRGEQLNLILKGEILEDLNAFKYLEAIVGKNGRV